jgi:hypothetical protein
MEFKLLFPRLPPNRPTSPADCPQVAVQDGEAASRTEKQIIGPTTLAWNHHTLPQSTAPPSAEWGLGVAAAVQAA